jgi:hypothetical protein
MEGILQDLVVLTSPWNIIGGVSLLAMATVWCVFGYTAEEEEAGRRLFWAEWPIPESESTSLKFEEELRIAA